MKKQNQFKEKGQALVMIAIAALVLFAFAALAIDGSIVFSDRRHSQNASDTAVLAAALAKVRGTDINGNDWDDAALLRAKENSYDNADLETQVIVTTCDLAPITTEDGKQFDCTGLPVGAIRADYILVHIKSVVHLNFARVLGWQTITNHTNAISRATEPIFTNWYDGYGIASTHQGCWGNANDVPFQLGGSSTTFVNGAGVLVSSICPGEDTISVSGNPDLDTTTGVCAPGTTTLPAGDEASLGNPGLQSTCNVPPPDYYTMPAEPQCLKADGTVKYGTVTDIDNDGIYMATAGTYTDTFPIDVQGGQATIVLGKGAYCLEDGIDMGAGWALTTDRNGNNAHDPASEGVFFFISGGDVTFNGGASVFIHAISSNTNPDFSDEWLNLLMYISNPAEVHITGGSGSIFTGTILAPNATVTIQGATDNFGGDVTLDAQIIADTVDITGNADIVIVYNESNNAQVHTNPGIALIK